MTDEELENMVGGFNIGDHVNVDTHMIRYCPGCSELAMISCGNVVGKTWYEKGHFFDVKTNC